MLYKVCVLKSFYKAVNLQSFFNRRGLKSKLGTHEALQGSFNVAPNALKGHVSARTLEGHLGTQTLSHFCTRGYFFSRLSNIYDDALCRK